MKDAVCIECFGKMVTFKDVRNNPPERVPRSEGLDFPFSSIASISHGSKYVGTAFLVSSKVVLTAAHVFVQQPYSNDSEFSIRFRSAGISAGVKNIYVHPEHDLAVAILDVDVELVNFSFKLPVQEDEVVVVGFPSMGKGIRQYYGNGVIKRIEGDVLVHDASTRDGHSGSPIMLRGEANLVVGIHREASGFPDENQGVAMSGEIESWVSSYIV